MGLAAASCSEAPGPGAPAAEPRAAAPIWRYQPYLRLHVLPVTGHPTP